MSSHVFSREPRLYKRVCPSVGPSVGPLVGPLVTLLSAGRDEPANDLYRVYELVSFLPFHPRINSAFLFPHPLFVVLSFITMTH